MSVGNQKWDTVIGLEVHVQVNSQTKAFCRDKNLFISEPNINISPISLAHPGTLPRPNVYHAEAGAKLGLAFGSHINKVSYFDRKNYFYPDLPKGYQITQDMHPICVGGSFSYPMPDGTKKTVRIHHLHMEEDAGKSVHDQHPSLTLLDYNRAGVPLLEIVTEPDLKSPEEVFHFIHFMQLLVRQLGISDGNMEEGSFRCDCNVSVKPSGSPTLGTRCEIKNLNSKKFAKAAILYEVARQIKMIESGGKIVQSTLLFSPSKGVTYPMRDKEEVNDYRYFNDPDLPPVILKDEYLLQWERSTPQNPYDQYIYLKRAFELDHASVVLIMEDKDRILSLEKMKGYGIEPREAALLLINKFIPDNKIIAVENADSTLLNKIKSFIDLISTKKIMKSIAYQDLYPFIWNTPEETLYDIADQHGWIISQDKDGADELIQEILEKFPDKVQAYKEGKKGLIGFFMGEAMKRGAGKYNAKFLKSNLETCLNK